LDGVGRHHQILIAPRHGITVFGNGALQEKAFVPQWTVNFVAEDSGANVNQILATLARPICPPNPEYKVMERLDTRHPGELNPAINDVIHVH
jgi:hypothetical protein